MGGEGGREGGRGRGWDDREGGHPRQAERAVLRAGRREPRLREGEWEGGGKAGGRGREGWRGRGGREGGRGGKRVEDHEGGRAVSAV